MNGHSGARRKPPTTAGTEPFGEFVGTHVDVHPSSRRTAGGVVAHPVVVPGMRSARPGRRNNQNVAHPGPGGSTAHPLNVSYRIGRVADYLGGSWLDLGCADGGYARALLASGVAKLFGIDIDVSRIEQASARGVE